MVLLLVGKIQNFIKRRHFQNRKTKCLPQQYKENIVILIISNKINGSNN